MKTRILSLLCALILLLGAVPSAAALEGNPAGPPGPWRASASLTPSPRTRS